MWEKFSKVEIDFWLDSREFKELLREKVFFCQKLLNFWGFKNNKEKVFY